MQTKDKKGARNIRDFLDELKSLGRVAKWAFKMADSPEVRPWAYKKYGFMLALIFFGLLQPAITSRVFSGVIERDVRTIAIAIGGITILFLLQRLFIFLTWRAHEYMYGPTLRNINGRITAMLFEKSPHQHKELKGLNHESIAKGKNRLFDLYINDIPEATEVIALIFISFGFLWFLLPSAGMMMTIFLLLYLVWTLYVNYRVSVECPEVEEEFSAFERYLASRWRFAERVIVSAKEDDELEELDKRWEAIISKDKKFWLWHLRQTTVRDTLGVFIVIAVFALGAKMVYDGEWASVGTLYPLFSWISVIKDNIYRIGHIQRNVSRYVPSVELMMKTLETKPAVIDKPGAIEFKPAGPVELKFSNLSYSYASASLTPKTNGAEMAPASGEINGKRREPVIKGVSFSVMPGEKVALIGPSGAGKSTLHYLALRFMDPDEGAILANGTDIREIAQKSWRKTVAYIPQKAQIFDGTVRDNLVYALRNEERKEWTDDKLIKLMSVLAIDFGKRPAGENPLDIVVGREGVQLSGGQSQRLAIGSAVIRKPKLLLVDEATSHLDSTTEKAVLDGLNELLSGTSVLIIAHRLSTVRSSDKIIVLSDGKVEASASTFEKLGAVSETFRRLANDQNLEIS